MFVGYARVSTADQLLELQIDALQNAGCKQIFTDKESGRKHDRTGLLQAIASMQPGDTLIVWKLSRLGRSLKQLIDTVQMLEERGIAFKSLNESIDTATAAGKLIFHVLAAVAQFESDNDRENTMAGLAAARAKGHIGGKPQSLDDQQKARAWLLFHGEPRRPVRQICRELKISKATLYRHVQQAA